jgi:hypothetical protein
MRYQKEHARLHNILADKDREIRFSRHALEEMEADQITAPDVLRVLTTGQVTWFEKKKDDIIHVEGRDVDGRRIRVVVGLRDTVKVLMIITAMERT